MVGALLDKGVDAPTATVGEQRDYAISMDIPALVNFYDAAIVDVVPAELAIPADTDFTNVTLTCTYADLTPCIAADLPPGSGHQTPDHRHHARLVARRHQPTAPKPEPSP